MNDEIDMHLAKAIADVAVFLEFSPEDVLDPDASVGAMEQLAAELQLMDSSRKASLAKHWALLADEHQGDQAEFVRNLANSFGLTS